MTAGIKVKEPCSWKESHDKPKSRDIILPTKQALGDSEAQSRLAFCSPWGRKELDIAQRLNDNTYRSFRERLKCQCLK